MEHKILNKPIEELMVITNGNEIAITNKNYFKEYHFCKTFDKEGKLIGCYNAGCNTIMENSHGLGSSMWRWLEEDIEKVFGMEIKLTLDNEDNIVIENPSNYSEINREKIYEFIKLWKKENEIHEKTEAFHYHNGKKYQSYYLVDSPERLDYFHWMKVDREKSEIILKELISNKFVHKSDDFEIFESERYTFTKYNFFNKPFAWYVSKK